MSDDPDAAQDLDAAMGRLELEAARRRADPGFPIDTDVRLAAELDSVAPRRGPSTPEALAAAVAALPMPDIEPSGPSGSSEPSRSSRPFLGRARPLSTQPRAGDPAADRSAEELRRVALGLIDVARSLDARVARLEAGRPPSASSAAGPGGADPGADPGADAWADAVVAHVDSLGETLAADPVAGRVWWSGPDAAEAVRRLRAHGLDAYGTDPSGDPWSTGVDGRRADPVAHLDAVADGALAAAILAGPLPDASAGRLTALVRNLTRTTATVVVCSPTPSWWRQVVGPAAADLGGDRPLGVDTWLDVLTGAGWTCTVAAGLGARTYVLTGRSPAGGVPISGAPVGGAPVGGPPVGEGSVGDAPVGDVPTGGVPVGRVPIGRIPGGRRGPGRRQDP